MAVTDGQTRVAVLELDGAQLVLIVGIHAIAVHAQPPLFAMENGAVAMIDAVICRDHRLGRDVIHEAHLDAVVIGALDVPRAGGVIEFIRRLWDDSAAGITDGAGVVHVEPPLADIERMGAPPGYEAERRVVTIPGAGVGDPFRLIGTQRARAGPQIVIESVRHLVVADGDVGLGIKPVAPDVNAGDFTEVAVAHDFAGPPEHLGRPLLGSVLEHDLVLFNFLAQFPRPC